MLSLPYAVHLGTADRAGTPRSGLSVLHGYLAGALHVPHCAALQAVGLHSLHLLKVSRAAPFAELASRRPNRLLVACGHHPYERPSWRRPLQQATTHPSHRSRGSDKPGAPPPTPPSSS